MQRGGAEDVGALNTSRSSNEQMAGAAGLGLGTKKAKAATKEAKKQKENKKKSLKRL